MPPIEAVIAENEQLRGELAQRDLAIAALQKQLQWLQQKVFGGGKSEKLDEAQLRLKLEELEKEAAAEPARTVTYERRSRRAKPTEAPAERFKDLPIEETVVIEPEEVKAAPGDFEEISREETFEVDVHPPRLFKRLIVRPKYRHRIDRTRPPVIAPAPARPIEGGYASAGLLAWIVLSKYLEHQPLYRQEKMSARWGAALSRKTMADWVETVAFWLKPLYNHMRLNLLAGDYLQADDAARSA
jgi:transposase